MPTTTQPPDKYAHALMTIQSLYDSYLAPTLPPALANVFSTLIAAAVRAQPFITQMTAMFTSLAAGVAGVGGGSAESTALLSTAVMIIVLYFSLRVFNYVRKMVFGWIVFAVKVVAVLVGVQLMLYVNRYGWENAVRDISWWGGIVWGFVEEVLEGANDQDTVPRGARSRTSAGTRQKTQYGYQAREQAPRAGRTRWT